MKENGQEGEPKAETGERKKTPEESRADWPRRKDTA